ncbi:hypothetical protein L917_01979 [Phytophthora nicotianae]|uniref:Uncharacterized protein n=1 Tax=Phytophthora nicotianae TaxID=4792 RepID=W2LVJ6_PHYNI|nr:hypothetical protein L917_01979 [Phytophthora nicotianae]
MIMIWRQAEDRHPNIVYGAHNSTSTCCLVKQTHFRFDPADHKQSSGECSDGRRQNGEQVRNCTHLGCMTLLAQAMHVSRGGGSLNEIYRCAGVAGFCCTKCVNLLLYYRDGSHSK